VSLTADHLRAIKRQGGPLGEGMKALLEMIDSYGGTVTSPPVFPNVEFKVFCNQYPEFTDTNNLSLVLFLHYPGLSIVFPGDIEKAGWKTLLQNVDFRAHLKRVNIFIASHHGRDNGYVPEVFDYCKPDIIVISDEAVQYSTQDHSYTQHARGITWNQTDVRKVLTTRKDGMLTITSRQPGYFINASK
jgi:beta-lactamase superfamily II metal-dependent hydrolase